LPPARLFFTQGLLVTLHHTLAPQRAEVVDIQCALDMVALVLHTRSFKIAGLERVPLPLQILGLHPHVIHPHLGGLPRLRHGQATLVERHGIAQFFIAGIGQYTQRIVLHLHDGKAQMNTDLHRRQADAAGIHHGVDHVVHQLSKSLVKDFHRSGYLPEPGIRKLNDGSDHTCNLI
jgi:hypothetical protein